MVWYNMIKRKHGKSPKTTATDLNAAPIELASSEAVPLSFFAMIVLHFSLLFLIPRSQVSGYIWYERVWGFDNIMFFSTPYVVVTYIAAIMISIPYSNEYLRKAGSGLFNDNTIAQIKRFKYALFVVISILSGLVFYLLRVKYPFLGDMDIRVGQTLRKEFFTSEYLTMWTAYHIHHALNMVSEVSGKQTFVLLSVISGSMYVYVVLLTADLLGRNFCEKSAICLSCLSIGGILLFFGYIEVYSIPSVFVMLYLYFALLWIKSKTSFIFPLMVLMLATGFHLMAIGLAPSFFYAICEKYSKRVGVLEYFRGKTFFLWSLCSMPLAFWLAASFQLTDLMPVFFDPAHPQVMTLFSAQHCWEFLNSQILASGVTFLVLPVLAVLLVRGFVRLDSVSWFLAAASLFMLFIAFAVNKQRGSGDWDICAFPAMIYVPMVVYILFNGLPTGFRADRVKYIISVVIVFNLLNTIPWIMINAGDKSIKKIASMLEEDPGYYYMTRLPALYNLALSYKANDLMDESLKCYEKIYLKFHQDPRSHVVYANALVRSGKQDQAISVLTKLLQNNPYYSPAYPALIQFYQTTNQGDRIIALLERLLGLYERDPDGCHKHFTNEQLIQYFSYLYFNKYRPLNDAHAMNRVGGVINRLQQQK